MISKYSYVSPPKYQNILNHYRVLFLPTYYYYYYNFNCSGLQMMQSIFYYYFLLFQIWK